jgi:hypothetical protein
MWRVRVTTTVILTIRSVYCSVACHYQQYKKCCANLLLWQIYVTGNNKTFLGPTEKWPTFFVNLNQIWIFSAYFIQRPQYQILRKSVQREPPLNREDRRNKNEDKICDVQIHNMQQQYEYYTNSVQLLIFLYLSVACRGNQRQTTPKNVPRMQRARAIPVAWLGSGSCQNRPKSWILIN